MIYTKSTPFRLYMDNLLEDLYVNHGYKEAPKVKEAMLKWVYPSIGHMTLEKIKEDDIRPIANHMLDEGLASGTIARHLGGMCVAFEHAVAHGLVDHNPCDKLRARFKKYSKESSTTVYTAEELKRVLLAISYNIYRDFFMIITCLGLRKSEATHLKIEDVDVEKNLVYIRKTRYLDFERVIPVPPEVMDNYIVPEIEYTFKMREYEAGYNPDNLVYTNLSGGTLDGAACLDVAMNEIKMESGVSEFNTTILRITFGALEYQSGSSLSYMKSFI